jgi:hypothetical protein
MDAEQIHQLLRDVQAGRIDPDEALDQLRHLPYDDLGFARVDQHRSLRKGTPEVVFCQNKTAQQVSAILQRLWQHHDRVLGTRAAPGLAEAVRRTLPEARYDPVSRLITLTRNDLPAPQGDGPFALVVCAGTSDLPVAEEAAQTLEFFGERTLRAYDVGVAGLHRLLDQRELLFTADVILSVAGMEGALTSVIGGLVSCPVIGVPTSVGYGASFAGLAALLAMLNSCAPGVAVVNIDNGFGAAQFAHLILQRLKREGEA